MANYQVPTTRLRELPAYEALAKHYSQIEGRHLRELFADDPNRGERLCAEGPVSTLIIRRTG